MISRRGPFHGGGRRRGAAPRRRRRLHPGRPSGPPLGPEARLTSLVSRCFERGVVGWRVGEGGWRRRPPPRLLGEARLLGQLTLFFRGPVCCRRASLTASFSSILSACRSCSSSARRGRPQSSPSRFEMGMGGDVRGRPTGGAGLVRGSTRAGQRRRGRRRVRGPGAPRGRPSRSTSRCRPCAPGRRASAGRSTAPRPVGGDRGSRLGAGADAYDELEPPEELPQIAPFSGVEIGGAFVCSLTPADRSA